MELIRNIQTSGLGNISTVASIGNFDGVHLGHRAVISQLVSIADELGLPSVVITFEPLPMEFFSPATAPARITDLREKIQLIEQLGVDKVVCLRFNQSLASLSAVSFIDEILINGLSIKALVVGEDFRFGNQREGNVELLREYGLKQGFKLIPAETYHYNGLRVSSSLVRGHLALGDFKLVQELLGRAYQIDGKVIHGEKRGRELGYPTTNMACRRINCPLSGVYVVRVHGLEKKTVYGVTNVGTRPVFSGDKLLIETHLFDFKRDVYGQRINVEFLKKLRDETQFHSVEALCEQMEKDVKKAKEFLGNK